MRKWSRKGEERRGANRCGSNSEVGFYTRRRKTGREKVKRVRYGLKEGRKKVRSAGNKGGL